MIRTPTAGLPFRLISFATGVVLFIFPRHSAAQDTLQALNLSVQHPHLVGYVTDRGVGWSFVPISDLLVTAVSSSAPQVSIWHGTNHTIATYDYANWDTPTNFQTIAPLLLSAGQPYSISSQNPNFTSSFTFRVFDIDGTEGIPTFTTSPYISQFASYYLYASGEWTSTTSPPSDNVKVVLVGPNFQFQLVSASPPQLTLIRSGADVILTWPTNATGFTLQSTTNLASTAVWTTNSPPPAVVNGQNTVTNTISGKGKFYRLSQ